MTYPDSLSSLTVVNNAAYEVRYIPAPRYIGYRTKHACEPGARITPNGMPEVDPSENIVSIPFTTEMQLLSWEVMHALNPTISRDQWAAVFSSHRAYTNDNGVETSHPKLMKGILAGGAFVRGVKGGTELTVTPGVGAVDCRMPLPTAQEVIERHWYFVATTGKFNAEGVWKVGNFPQGNGGPVAVVYFLNAPARYVGSWFQPWDSDVLPDPYKIYL